MKNAEKSSVAMTAVGLGTLDTRRPDQGELIRVYGVLSTAGTTGCGPEVQNATAMYITMASPPRARHGRGLQQGSGAPDGLQRCARAAPRLRRHTSPPLQSRTRQEILDAGMPLPAINHMPIHICERPWFCVVLWSPRPPSTHDPPQQGTSSRAPARKIPSGFPRRRAPKLPRDNDRRLR